ncbi:DNA-formamidopyrimidine glycosylase family protein [Aurantiacibacter spongiae]|uniref:DNA-formamidopyrimidine glycosylase n=1 Tax=Aurantiacibacter spongiae TaxID=2488860 RepID=A0A3N5DIN5_9SPHN|nr:DNA-formamidopyrimidine glycosylase family protein [Aurantiacibacter spongiae]RPF70495.1 DNA-formamidopyrimidine glycosylase [Aurantiacibacter spongiae]
MPELPEAEANRRRVAEQCLNRTIEEATLGKDISYIELPGDNELGRLAGRQFTQTHRHGKLIFAGSQTGPWICVHLGMTGKLLPFDADERDAPDYTKFLIRFEGTRRLAYRCPRKLGWVRVVDSPGEEIERIGFGPDALDMSREDFLNVIGGTNGTIKGALMAQHKLAGIGNLWSDEILFQTGVAPDRTASDLSGKTIGDMYADMRRILTRVCEVNADYDDLPRSWLIGSREDGAKCPRCDGTIRKSKVAGRSAHACDRHQT